MGQTRRAAASFQAITLPPAHRRPLMTTCVNMGVGLEDKANVSVSIGTASLGFPNTISWLGALKPPDYRHPSRRSFWGQISPSDLWDDQSYVNKSQ